MTILDKMLEVIFWSKSLFLPFIKNIESLLEMLRSSLNPLLIIDF
jgi:hypothetical protein